jgi:replicative DNA helicase
MIQPPHNREAENAFLGSCLINPEIIGLVDLRGDDFYIVRNGYIWTAMRALQELGRDIDFTTLSNELNSRRQMEEVGGSSYLSELVLATPTSSNYGSYADIIRTYKKRRVLLETADRFAKLAYNMEVDNLDTCVDAALMPYKNTKEVNERIPSAIEANSEFINALSEDNIVIPTGIGLDRYTGGLWRRTLTGVGARPSVGKTAMMFQIARNAVSRGFRVIFFSMEMSMVNLWARAACGITRVPYTDILSKRASTEDTEKVMEASRELVERFGDKLMIDDKKQSTRDMFRKCADLRPDLVVQDHIRRCTDYHKEERHRLGNITENMNQMAKELNLACLCAIQLSRNLENREDKVPTLADFRDSGEIEENLDLALGLHRERVYVEQSKELTPASLHIIKFRDGASHRVVNMTFDGLAQWFEDRV